MAITIVQQPYDCSAIGQKLIVVATSDNVALDGFKYFIDVEVVIRYNDSSSIIKEYIFYVSPNPAGALVFDVAPILIELLPDNSTFANNSVHGFTDDTNQRFPCNVIEQCGVIIREAYNLGGVLTVDYVAASGDATFANLIPAKLQIEDGYRPDPELSFGMVDTSSRFLTDRKKGTYKFTLEPLINLDPDAIIIPVREKDYGIFTTTDKPNYISEFDKLEVSICDDTNSISTHSFSRTNITTFSHAAVYPANLNNSAMALTIKPQDYPNWKFIKVGTNGKSANYYLINIDHYEINQECKHDNVRIAWVGSRGGWEYFNFNKKNEESVQVERKRYEKVVGSYDTAAFNFLPTDAGLKELKPVVQRFITVNSDWIQEGEFEYLKGLIVSDTVHMVLDSGTHIPMLVEQNDYTAARERNGKLKNLTLKLRYANDLNV